MRSFFILLLRNDVGADTGEKEQFKYHWPGNFFFENNAIQKFGRNGAFSVNEIDFFHGRKRNEQKVERPNFSGGQGPNILIAISIDFELIFSQESFFLMTTNLS